MSVITSKESKTFKELQRLTQKKYRDREGLFIAEGPNVVGEAIDQDEIDVLRIFAREGSGYEDYTDNTVVLSDKLFDTVSDTVTSQGVIAVVRKPDRGTAADVMQRLSDGIKTSGAAGRGTKVSGASDGIKTSGDVIVLDRLQDPGNIGTILRTAEGAGISAAVFVKGTCDPFSPKVVRACAGSILRMPIVFCDTAEEFIKIAADTGCKLAVTDVRNGVPYYRAGLCRAVETPEKGTAERSPIALVIGNEGNGVSDTFLKAADILVNIPMHGKLESLNASVAAALLMYEMSRPE